MALVAEKAGLQTGHARKSNRVGSNPTGYAFIGERNMMNWLIELGEALAYYGFAGLCIALAAKIIASIRVNHRIT